MTDTSAERPDHARLFEIASEQQGFFTAAQARASGFSWDLLTHHTHSGRYIRIRRGLYRLRDYPSTSRPEVMAALLAVGKDVAVVSHESALDLLNLSDVTPNEVHLIVPRSKRYTPKLPGTVIHTTTRPFGPDDVMVREGVLLTTATRTILDAAEAGTAPEQIEMAVAQALERGLITAQQLREESKCRPARVSRLIAQALETVKT